MDTTGASWTLHTTDGLDLVADLAIPDGAVAAAVLLPPHPRFGGNRLNAIVAALYRSLPAAGIAALRFDFRTGAGAEGSDLADERLDAVAALAELAGAVPDVPLLVVGYSFGAVVGLGVDHPGVIARVAIAPPLAVLNAALGEPRPTLVLVPAFDQFSPPAVTEPRFREWSDTTVETIRGADHFLLGRAAAIADRVTAWLLDLIG